MKHRSLFFAVLLTASTSLATEKCHWHSEQSTRLEGALRCNVSTNGSLEKRIELSVVTPGICTANDFSSLSEIGTLELTASNAFQTLAVTNARGLELLKLDISSYIKNGERFFFRLSFPRQGTTSSTIIFDCKFGMR